MYKILFKKKNVKNYIDISIGDLRLLQLTDFAMTGEIGSDNHIMTGTSL